MLKYPVGSGQHPQQSHVLLLQQSLKSKPMIQIYGDNTKVYGHDLSQVSYPTIFCCEGNVILKPIISGHYYMIEQNVSK